MLPFQTLKTRVENILKKFKGETGMEFKCGYYATKKIDKYLEVFLEDLVRTAITYTEHRGRKVIKESDLELAWQVLNSGRR